MRQLLENNAPFAELAKRIALRFIQTRASLQRIVFIVMCFHLQIRIGVRDKNVVSFLSERLRAIWSPQRRLYFMKIIFAYMR